MANVSVDSRHEARLPSLTDEFILLRQQFEAGASRWPMLECYLLTWPEAEPARTFPDYWTKCAVPSGPSEAALRYTTLYVGTVWRDTPRHRYRDGSCGALVVTRDFGRLFGDFREHDDPEESHACGSMFKDLATRAADCLDRTGTLSSETMSWSGHTRWLLAMFELLGDGSLPIDMVANATRLRSSNAFLDSARAVSRLACKPTNLGSPALPEHGDRSAQIIDTDLIGELHRLKHEFQNCALRAPTMTLWLSGFEDANRHPVAGTRLEHAELQSTSFAMSQFSLLIQRAGLHLTKFQPVELNPRDLTDGVGIRDEPDPYYRWVFWLFTLHNRGQIAFQRVEGTEAPEDPGESRYLLANPAQASDVALDMLLLILARRGGELKADIIDKPLNSEADGPDDRTKLTGEALALATIVQYPEWTDIQVAKHIGYSRTSLYRWPRYREAKASLRASRADHPRGTRDGETGSIEAWED